MPKIHKPRAGSLQYWPRKRAEKILPSVNWGVLEKKYVNATGPLGFICYKAGMARVLVNDLTKDSMTKNKQIILPVSVLECPQMKIFGVRLYKNNVVIKDLILGNLDKELKRVIKVPKKQKTAEDIIKEIEEMRNTFENLRILIYTLPKQVGLKKTPEVAEIALGGDLNNKIEFVKSHLGKILTIRDYQKVALVDVHGVTKGKGLCGPVKRFGIGLKKHKSEKGRRRPGSLGPWHPNRVTFRAPLAGQYGFFTRVAYNAKVLLEEQQKEWPFEFHHYGKPKNYIVLKGSVQGPPKRQLLLTFPLRETKKRIKENFEIIEFLK